MAVLPETTGNEVSAMNAVKDENTHEKWSVDGGKCPLCILDHQIGEEGIGAYGIGIQQGDALSVEPEGAL